MVPEVSQSDLRSPQTRPTFVPDAADAIVDYLLAESTGKFALDGLYAGASLCSVDSDGGTAELMLGGKPVRLPHRMLSPGPPELGRPISRGETLSIASALCRRIGWSVVLDFIYLRKRLPIYAELFDAARNELWCPSSCWVLSHALSLLHADAQCIVRASFNLLLNTSPGGSHKHLGKKLEQILSQPWAINEAQTERLFCYTQPFGLCPRIAGQTEKPTPHLMLCDTVPINYPLRDRCWLAIVCAAHSQLIWPDDRPGVFAHA